MTPLSAHRELIVLDNNRICMLLPGCAGKVRRLAVDATLRAAAPYQLSRRRRAAASGKPARKIYIDQDDLR